MLVSLLFNPFTKFRYAIFDDEEEDDKNDKSDIVCEDGDDDDDMYYYLLFPITLGIFIIEYSSGSSDSLYKSKDLIITMITSDFDKSPTVGYVRAADVEHVFDISNKSNSLPPALPNPFADEQTINSTLTLVISEAIDSAQSIGFKIGRA